MPFGCDPVAQTEKKWYTSIYMVRSIGLDLVDIDRIAQNVEAYGQRFLKKILGPYELRLYEIRQDKVIFVAGRFAAKEAILKGLGQFIDKRPKLPSIQITNDHTGRPHVDFGDAIPELGPKIKCFISITHERNHAAAVAIFVEE